MAVVCHAGDSVVRGLDLSYVIDHKLKVTTDISNDNTCKTNYILSYN